MVKYFARTVLVRIREVPGTYHVIKPFPTMDTTFSVDRQGETIESKVDSLRGKGQTVVYSRRSGPAEDFPERKFSISKRISEAKL